MPTSAPEVKAERPNVVLLQPWIRIEAPQQDEIQQYVQADDSAAVRSAAPQSRGCCAPAWQCSQLSVRASGMGYAWWWLWRRLRSC